MQRRQFLQALGTAALVGGSCAPDAAATAGGPRWAMVIDVKRCFGCHACTVACKAEQDAPLGGFKSWVLGRESGQFPAVKREFVRVQCNQCDAPPCVEGCPTDATWKLPNAVVTTDAQKCIGCGICVRGCPYGMRYLHPQTNKAEKCDFCLHRVEQGLAPACVTTCNAGAIVFGDLADPSSRVRRMLDESGQQVTLQPDLKTQPRVYYIGLEDAGLAPLGTDPAAEWRNR